MSKMYSSMSSKIEVFIQNISYLFKQCGESPDDDFGGFVGGTPVDVF